MRQILLIIILLIPSLSLFGQEIDADQWCKEYFWRSVNTNHLDTLTVFNDHSLCIKELPDRIYQLKYLKQLILDT